MIRRRTPGALPWSPTIPEIDAAPELSILAALVAVLDIVSDALWAANPELGDDCRPYWRPPPATVCDAANILRGAARLRCAVDRYHQAVTSPPAPEPPPSDDILF